MHVLGPRMRILGRMVPLTYRAAAVGVIMVVSGSIAVYATSANDFASAPPQVEVPGVSSERLQEAGITLSPPGAGAAASITEESAVRTGAVFDLKVRGSVLAQLHYSSSVPNIDRLVWVVSFDTNGSARSGGGGFGPGEHSETPIAWSIAVVDAITGELLFTMEGGLP